MGGGAPLFVRGAQAAYRYNCCTALGSLATGFLVKITYKTCAIVYKVKVVKQKLTFTSPSPFLAGQYL
jgi:hypothetical protein